MLSLPGSIYFQDGANIETSTVDMKNRLVAAELEPDEVVFSMNVESLYTNVPLMEAILLAADKLYASDKQPPMDKETFIRLLSVAVTNVHFISNGRWYKQYDGVAMGSALSVILANLWLSQYEGALSGTDTTLSVSSSRPNEDKYKAGRSLCIRCQTIVTKRGYSIRCTDLKVDDMRR